MLTKAVSKSSSTWTWNGIKGSVATPPSCAPTMDVRRKCSRRNFPVTRRPANTRSFAVTSAMWSLKKALNTIAPSKWQQSMSTWKASSFKLTKSSGLLWSAQRECALTVTRALSWSVRRLGCHLCRKLSSTHSSDGIKWYARMWWASLPTLATSFSSGDWLISTWGVTMLRFISTRLGHRERLIWLITSLSDSTNCRPSGKWLSWSCLGIKTLKLSLLWSSSVPNSSNSLLHMGTVDQVGTKAQCPARITPTPTLFSPFAASNSSSDSSRIEIEIERFL